MEVSRCDSLPSDWVAISQTFNWLNQDPLLDWLSLFGSANGFVRDNESDDYVADADFNNFIKRKGREFEKRVVALLNERLTRAGVRTAVEVPREASHLERIEQTLSLMRAGIPLICQPLLTWSQERTYGSPDILIRSDVFHLLMDAGEPLWNASSTAPLITGESWHYVCADIKFSSISLDSNAEIGNDDKNHKVQLALYNEALAEAQGYKPARAFLIGRGWKKGSGEKLERSNSCLDRFLPVTLPIQAQHKAEPKDWTVIGIEAIDWLRKVSKEGASWHARPQPSNDNLRPNMKNTHDAPWHKAKAEIAAQIGEPTVVWNLGIADRNVLIRSGHSDWRCANFELTTPKSNDTGARQLEMLRVNRCSNGPGYHPVPLTFAQDEWLTPEPLEFYVDFETTSNLDDDFSKLPEKGGQPLIFMIGCGHFEPLEERFRTELNWQLDPAKRHWHFRCFTTNDLTEAEEILMVREWYRYMEQIRARVPGANEKPKVFHWSPAETRTYSTALDSAYERHLKPEGWPEPNWYDFLKRVIKPSGVPDAFYVRGSWGFGLKAIGKALFKLGRIETEWKDGLADGLSAMSGAWVGYRLAQEMGVPKNAVRFKDKAGRERPFFEEIIAYNQVDCKVMAEAIQTLRKLGRT